MLLFLAWFYTFRAETRFMLHTCLSFRRWRSLCLPYPCWENIVYAFAVTGFLLRHAFGLRDTRTTFWFCPGTVLPCRTRSAFWTSPLLLYGDLFLLPVDSPSMVRWLPDTLVGGPPIPGALRQVTFCVVATGHPCVCLCSGEVPLFTPRIYYLYHWDLLDVPIHLPSATVTLLHFRWVTAVPLPYLPLHTTARVRICHCPSPLDLHCGRCPPLFGPLSLVCVIFTYAHLLRFAFIVRLWFACLPAFVTRCRTFITLRLLFVPEKAYTTTGGRSTGPLVTHRLPRTLLRVPFVAHFFCLFTPCSSSADTISLFSSFCR